MECPNLECAKLGMPKAWYGKGRPTVTGSTLLIFLLGGLMGVLMGGAPIQSHLRAFGSG
jgi:hypothetical protein